MPNAKVIDLDQKNTIPESLRPARSAGVVGMVHKATEGNEGVDSKAEARVYLAKDAGMLTGLYHVVGDGSARDQARHFLSRAEELGLQDNWLLAVAPSANAVDGDKIVEVLKEVEKQARRSPVLFSGVDALNKMKSQERALAQYRLWLSQFETVANVPTAFGKYFLWQFTDQGTVDGVNPPVHCSEALVQDNEAFAKVWSGFKGQTDTSLPEAPPAEAAAPVEPQAPTMTPEGELDNAPAPDTGDPEGGTTPEDGEHVPQATTTK